METIQFEDYKKLEIRIGKILSAQPVEGSDKLLKLEVDFGVLESGEPSKRQILAGIAKHYTLEALVGRQCPFAYNLAPRALMGLESQGMILCPSDSDGNPVIMHPDKEVLPGALVK